MIKNYKKEWEKKIYHNQFAKSAIVCHGSEVKNSSMGEYSRLKSFSELRNSKVGDYTIISSYSIINAGDIGKFTSIGPGVFVGLWEHNQWVSTHSFYLSEACGNFVKGFQNYAKDNLQVKMGNDVWVGANAVILKGVTIGDGAIIGAGSVVTKDVPPYAVVVGNASRILRYRFSQNDIKYLLKIKWWDFKRSILQKMVDQKIWDSVDKIKAFCRTNKI